MYIAGVTPGGSMGVSEAVMAASSGAKTVYRDAGFDNAGIKPAFVTAAFSKENPGSSSKDASVGLVSCVVVTGVGSTSSLLQAEKNTPPASSNSIELLILKNIFIQ